MASLSVGVHTGSVKTAKASPFRMHLFDGVGCFRPLASGFIRGPRGLSGADSRGHEWSREDVVDIASETVVSGMDRFCLWPPSRADRHRPLR